MVTQVLKERTAHLHDTIESIVASKKIFEGSFTGEDYINLLAINAAVVFAYLDNIFDALPAEIQAKLTFNSTAKKEALQNDFQELNISFPEEKMALKENNLPYALGALYVMEGSMLGGSVIAKTLKKDDAFANHAFNYFTFHKEMLGPNWKKFLDLMNETVTTQADIETCVAGAVQVYETLITSAKSIFA